MLLLEAVHVVWILEQPSGSQDTLPWHPRFSWFSNWVSYVPQLCLWGFHLYRYGGSTSGWATTDATVQREQLPGLMTLL